jgi:L-seryl-tRNA(Ser) seleniumtransferase
MDDARPASPRRLPSVDAVLRSAVGATMVARFGHAATVDGIRAILAAHRASGTIAPVDAEQISARTLALLEERDAPTLRRVFNLTGTVLHTNLGRAVLPEAAIAAAVQAMRHAANIEYDISSGQRGERDDHVRGLIREITGAEDCVVVNNNAAAVLLVLNEFGNGREAIVSRGELIEIGGAFRLPDIMARAGAKLVEVGTTNRTHLRDFEGAITASTGLVMKAHTSNYLVQGFTASVPAAELAALARARGVPFIDDLGSGTLIDLARYGMKHEPTVQDALQAGADLVTFSGDKLLGGPQVGIVAGRKDLIARIAKNPLKRALRVDKIRMAALAATLKLYRDPDRLAEALPTLRYFTRKRSDLYELAQRIAPIVERALGDTMVVAAIECASQIGSGALPLDTLPSAGLAITPRDDNASGALVEQLAAALRRAPIPVIGRIHDAAFMLDLRCLDDEVAFTAQLPDVAGAFSGRRA